jgi:hypothetical protein
MGGPTGPVDDIALNGRRPRQGVVGDLLRDTPGVGGEDAPGHGAVLLEKALGGDGLDGVVTRESCLQRRPSQNR